MKSFDVMVLGGGPAGFPAAIQAARAGARVLLVEKSGQLGGTTSLNRVAFPGIFHAWGRQIIAGIGWDLVRRTVELEGRKLPDFSDIHASHWKHQIPLCPTLFSALIDQDVIQSGCELCLHTMLATIRPKPGGGWVVTLCGKEGLYEVETAWCIDATGDANAASLAGCPFQADSPELQPGTLVFRLDGYNPESMDIPRLDEAARMALKEGKLHKGDFGWSGDSLRSLLSSRGNNSIHIFPINAVDSPGKTSAEILGRAALLRIYRFLKTLPGFETLHFTWSAPECGIRETRRIAGRSMVTYKEYVSGWHWPDAVCYSFYPIDLHTDEGLKYEKLKEGIVPTIPLSAMLPQGVPGFLCAGRCASGDRLANSAYRVQASCMAMGQAAGAAAALAVQSGLAEADLVNLSDLRKVLEAQGAIFPTNGT